MRTTTLGQGGPEISQLGFGAMSFAGFYGPTTEDAAHAVLDATLDLGVTHIDTSNVYGMGKSEEMIGSWLASRPGARDRTTIATKASIRRDGPPDNSPAHLTGELDKSLARLGTDYVDLFYIHRREAARPIEEVAETLAGIVASGKARTVGFSEIAPTSLRKAHAITPIAAVQSEYSLATRYPDLGLTQTCQELGVLLVAFSPVARCYLTDAPYSLEAAQSFPFVASNPRFTPENYAANIAITDRFRALAAEMGEPAAALAIAWLVQKGPHVVPIPGTRSVDHLKELVRGMEISLTEGDLAAIEAVLPVGWAHGDRYSEAQWKAPEKYC